MPSLGGDQYKWYCEIPPLAEPGNYPGGVKTKPPFEMGVDDFDSTDRSVLFYLDFLLPAVLPDGKCGGKPEPGAENPDRPQAEPAALAIF